MGDGSNLIETYENRIIHRKVEVRGHRRTHREGGYRQAKETGLMKGTTLLTPGSPATEVCKVYFVFEAPSVLL